MATQPPSEMPVPSTTPDYSPAPEFDPPAPDFDQPSPTTEPDSPQPAQM